MFIQGNDYKYKVEGTIIMYLDSYDIIQQQDFNIFQEITSIKKYNIYFILKRPKITIDPNSFDISEKNIGLEFLVHNYGNIESRKISINNIFGTKNIKLKSKYPYNYFVMSILNHDNFIFKSNYFLDEIQRENPKKDEVLDYEVLYIGQSVGDSDDYNILKRLESHSTLQKIYSESILNNPDSDIWIMLANFRQINMTSVNGMINSKSSDDIELKRFESFYEGKFSDKQKINFTEAALIKTFKPKYNKEYKNTFPNPNHSSYEECYKLDISGIVIELDLTSINRWLYTDIKPRGNDIYYHRGEHLFADEKERYNMFFNDYI